MRISGCRCWFMVIGAMALFLVEGVSGQSPQQFEVAVNRPNLAGASTGTSFNMFEGGLLAERFHLKFHRETREQTAYALVAEKPKLKVKTEGEATAMNTSGGPGKSRLVGTAVSMGALANYVGNR